MEPILWWIIRHNQPLRIHLVFFTNIHGGYIHLGSSEGSSMSCLKYNSTRYIARQNWLQSIIPSLSTSANSKIPSLRVESFTPDFCRKTFTLFPEILPEIGFRDSKILHHSSNRSRFDVQTIQLWTPFFSSIMSSAQCCPTFLYGISNSISSAYSKPVNLRPLLGPFVYRPLRLFLYPPDFLRCGFSWNSPPCLQKINY